MDGKTKSSSDAEWANKKEGGKTSLFLAFFDKHFAGVRFLNLPEFILGHIADFKEVAATAKAINAIIADTVEFPNIRVSHIAVSPDFF